MKRLLLTLVAIATLFACGTHEPVVQGKVIDRNFSPAHWEGGYETYYTPEYRCRYEQRYDYDSETYRDEQVCGVEQVSHQVYESQHTWHGDNWRLRLEDCRKNNEGEMKCRKGWRTVTENEYERHPLGAQYPRTEETNGG